MSQVYRVGEGSGALAVKVTVPETVNGLRTRERPIKPEDLVIQARRALQAYKGKQLNYVGQ